METRIPGATENLWDAGKAEGLSPLEALAYRSNLLGSDRAVANYGGGNTSTKAREKDHAGREVDVLWVKGSGSDLRTIRADQFTGLKLDEALPLGGGDGRGARGAGLGVKGWGSDLAAIRADQFTGLKLDEVLPLEERTEMSDEEMVAYLARCPRRPDMPREIG